MLLSQNDNSAGENTVYNLMVYIRITATTCMLFITKRAHTHLELLVHFLAVVVEVCQIEWPKVSIKAAQSREW